MPKFLIAAGSAEAIGYEKNLQDKKFSPGRPITFGKTLTPLLEGKKVVTRRDWKDVTARYHSNRYRQGLPIQAFDVSQRNGGKRIGWLKLNLRPYQEKLADMPEEEVKLEGFSCMSKQEFIDKFFKGDSDRIVWVIRFRFFPIYLVYRA